MSEKAQKYIAHYREGNDKEHCGICTMFVLPDSCTSVEGKIFPDDLCDYFKKVSESDKKRIKEKIKESIKAV